MATYAYVRFSNDEQGKGDSLRRQIEGVTEYAKRHDLELAEKYIIQDLGVSAFDGSNVTKGNLSKFLEKVRGGNIARGSILIVESLDRLSRLGISESQDLLRTFRQAGITVRTYVDGHVYNANDFGLIDLVVSGVKQATANEESIKKQDRVRKAWEKKRERALKEPIGGRCPGWLSYDKVAKKFVRNEERVRVVRRIFRDSASGIGNVVIMKRLNADNIPPFGSAEGWRSSSVAKILANRAVLGEFQLHKMDGNKRVPIGDPIPNYFPEIIDPKLFYRAKDSRKQRLVSDHPRGGRTGTNFANLFSHISRCVYCNGPMTFEDKGANGRNRYLVCSNARRGRKDICQVATSWRYEQFETTFLTFVDELDLPSIMNSDADARERAIIQDELAALKGKVASIVEKRQAVFELLQKTNIAFVAKQLTNLEREEGALVAEIVDKETELASLKSSTIAVSEVKDLISQLQNKEYRDLYKLRAQVAMKLKSIVDVISVAATGIPNARLEELMDAVGEKNREDAMKRNLRFFSVQFKSGIRKDIMPNPDDPSDYVELVIDDAAMLLPDVRD
jgi:DNA invertase Pin-like site-specific DNA recombinase